MPSRNQKTTNAAPPTPQPSASVELVSPALAKEWLNRNDRNRRIRPSLIARYARDMAAGRWKETGEAIKFAPDGTLLDGQHRLRAIVEADAPVRLFIVRDVDESAQSVMDTGAGRRAADAYHIAGVSHGSTLAAAARLAVLVGDGDRPVRHRDRAVSHAELFEWVEHHPDIADVVEFVSANRVKSNIRLPVSVLAYCCYRLSQVDADEAETFFVALATRANLPLGSPVLTLANRLDRIARERFKLSNYQAVWMVLRAWNAWRDGESLARLLIPETVDSFPNPK